MRVDLFDFDLPPERIALRPASPRDSARLLHVHAGAFDDLSVRDLPSLLRPGDILVFNDTRVLPVQFTGLRAARETVAHAGAAGLTGARFEVTLHKRLGPNTWAGLVRGAKKLKTGDRVTLNGALGALVAGMPGEGEVLLAFEEEGAALDAAIAAAGGVPLPPYIASKRKPDARDREDYQTVYARAAGSVAAPTAGLHFTPALLAALDARGVARVSVTLHVGAGTFLPVKAADTRDHIMHSEWGEVTVDAAAAINAARAGGGRVIAIGTTALRLLESAADEAGRVRPFLRETDIFITPGYRFRAVDGLMTNFHLPKSTLFMLVCAFAGTETMKSAYAHAIAAEYRFYSYGDASLLWRAPQ